MYENKTFILVDSLLLSRGNAQTWLLEFHYLDNEVLVYLSWRGGSGDDDDDDEDKVDDGEPGRQAVQQRLR